MRYDKGSLADTLCVARKLAKKHGASRYIVPTYFGWEIYHNHDTFDRWYEVTSTGEAFFCERDWEANTVKREARHAL